MNSNRNVVIAFVVVLAVIAAGYFIANSSKKPATGNSAEGNVNAVVLANEPITANGNINTNGSVTLNENQNTSTIPPDLTYEEELYMEASIDWKTHANADIGYSVKYPKDWNVEETFMTRSELLVSPVRYITVTSPGASHVLTLGVKRSTDEFLITDRTGVGAGDFVSDGNVTVADTSVPASRLVYQGKTKEWYAAKNGPGQSTVGSHVINASLSAGPGVDYSSVDLAGSPELLTAKAILSTLVVTK